RAGARGQARWTHRAVLVAARGLRRRDVQNDRVVHEPAAPTGGTPGPLGHRGGRPRAARRHVRDRLRGAHAVPALRRTGRRDDRLLHGSLRPDGHGATRTRAGRPLGRVPGGLPRADPPLGPGRGRFRGAPGLIPAGHRDPARVAGAEGGVPAPRTPPPGSPRARLVAMALEREARGFLPAAGRAPLALYDLGIALAMRERTFRGRLIDQVLDGDPAPQVLDIGCGTGTLAIALAARGAQVRAVDPDERALSR